MAHKFSKRIAAFHENGYIYGYIGEIYLNPNFCLARNGVI